MKICQHDLTACHARSSSLFRPQGPVLTVLDAAVDLTYAINLQGYFQELAGGVLCAHAQEAGRAPAEGGP